MDHGHIPTTTQTYTNTCLQDYNDTPLGEKYVCDNGIAPAEHSLWYGNHACTGIVRKKIVGLQHKLCDILFSNAPKWSKMQS